MSDCATGGCAGSINSSSAATGIVGSGTARSAAEVLFSSSAAVDEAILAGLELVSFEAADWSPVSALAPSGTGTTAASLIAGAAGSMTAAAVTGTTGCVPGKASRAALASNCAASLAANAA